MLVRYLRKPGALPTHRGALWRHHQRLERRSFALQRAPFTVVLKWITLNWFI